MNSGTNVQNSLLIVIYEKDVQKEVSKCLNYKIFISTCHAYVTWNSYLINETVQNTRNIVEIEQHLDKGSGKLTSLAPLCL